MNKKYSLVTTLTLMLLASALTCLILLYDNGAVLRALKNKNYAAGSDFGALLEKIEEMYIGEYDVDEISSSAMRSAVNALGDNWSYYLTPEEYADFLNSSNNQFAGIGVRIVIDEVSGGMKVMDIYSGSPAEKAGIVAGDIITGIDGAGLAGMDLYEMRDFLARPIGETAELTVLRAGGAIELITVSYELVFVDPISYEMLDGNIGYIDIANFESGAADGFISAIDLLQEQGALAFIFDVRSNGGGRVSEMTRMLDYLLPEGEIFISVGKDGQEEITRSGPGMVDAPAVVMVDKYSFSAAEYFAATLREYDYAKIVGEQTTGKSRSQRTETLQNGGALHISTSQYLTKNRVALYDVGGLTPDYPLVLNDDEFTLLLTGNLDKNDDPQLKLALSLLQGVRGQ